MFNIQFRAVQIMGLSFIKTDSLSAAVVPFPGEFPGSRRISHSFHRHFCRLSPTEILSYFLTYKTRILYDTAVNTFNSFPWSYFHATEWPLHPKELVDLISYLSYSFTPILLNHTFQE